MPPDKQAVKKVRPFKKPIVEKSCEIKDENQEMTANVLKPVNLNNL